jgi:hypothetical protein
MEQRARFPVSEQVEVHPIRVRQIAIVVAVLVFIPFAVGGVLLRATPTGVYFRVSDQVAMVLVGALLGLGVLLFARPRLRADAEGVEVRNVLSTGRYQWSDVQAITFPEGASWARLELPGDEYVPILAIQSSDGQRAVEAMRSLRHLRREVTAAGKGDPIPG